MTVPVTVLQTLALVGVDAHPIRVECVVAPGLPGLRLVGLPDVAVRESGERVRTAVQRAGFRWPQTRVVVNLAPADLPKAGSGFDLPIALAVLVASGQLVLGAGPAPWVFGELGLDGRLRDAAVHLAVAVGARRLGAERLLLPDGVGAAAADRSVRGLEVRPAAVLREAAALLAGDGAVRPPRAAAPAPAPALAQAPAPASPPDLADVRGQALARRALEVAAAGGHHLLLVGPPGCGKSLLARRLAGLLPDLDDEAALEVATVHAAAGGPNAVPGPRPPLRAPQTGISAAALVGGGSGVPRPGEASLAHQGVLVLDELLELPRPVLDALRQPLEEGRVIIDRARGRVEMPARFQLVATTNACPCGLTGHPRRACICPPERAARYRARLSGPLLDRIDVVVALAPLTERQLADATPGEASREVARRVEVARARSLRRTGTTVADAPIAAVRATVDARAVRLLTEGLEALGGSARGFERTLRVARTLADLAGSDEVDEPHVAEALAWRPAGLPGAGADGPVGARAAAGLGA